MNKKNKFNPLGDNRSHSGEKTTIVSTTTQKVKTLYELKKLEKTLDSLIVLGKEDIASKYLTDFLENKKVKSLDDYLKKLV